MFGFTTFAGAPFATAGSSVVTKSEVYFLAEAVVKADASAIWDGDITILGTADVTVMGTIAGSGWVRQNPDTPEWDVTKSQDWNRIN